MTLVEKESMGSLVRNTDWAVVWHRGCQSLEHIVGLQGAPWSHANAGSFTTRLWFSDIIQKYLIIPYILMKSS